MLKPLIEILPVDLDADKCILVCEISNEGFSYAIKNDDENTYVAIAVFQFDKSNATDDYSVILQNELQRQSLLSGNFKKVHLMYSFGESVLIPFSLYNSVENKNVLNLIHGDLQSNVSVLTDIIVENAFYNSYRITTNVLNVIKSKFPRAADRHQYSVLLEKTPVKGDNLLIIFYREKIVLMLNKNGSPQFINTFCYSTTEDVLYILLNTCRQFEVENIPVEISGMIEMHSPLTKEIQKYFNPVNFTELPASHNFCEEITKYPSHYFSYIFSLDSCE